MIREGVLTGFLYDLPRARKEGVVSTGNAARAGARTPPAVRPTNLILQPGVKPPKELVSEMHQGLLVTQVMGTHTADPITGDFSLGISGLSIRDRETRTPRSKG